MTHRRLFALLVACASIATSDSIASGQERRSVLANDVAGLRATLLGEKIRLEGVLNRTAARQEGLLLERFSPFSSDAKVVVHTRNGEVEQPLPATAYFKGTIEGEPDSRVMLAVREDGRRRGLVFDSAGSWMLGPHPARSQDPLEMKRLDPRFLADAAGFRCETDLVSPPTREENAALAGLESGVPPPQLDFGVAPARTARVAVETDFEFYSLFSGTADATHYVADLFASMSLIYESEIGTSLTVVYLSLWTTAADPWDQTAPNCALYQFSRYWNVNQGAVTRSLAHMLSGRSLGGGVAWRPSLCDPAFLVNHGGVCPGLAPQTDNYGGAYSFIANIDGTFEYDDPAVVWDTVASAHEIGHVFGSKHTHCYAGIASNPEQVDRCYGLQQNVGDSCNGTTHNWDLSGCSCDAGMLPGTGSVTGGTPGAGNGTIMSYCHALAPGQANISYTFGTGFPFGVDSSRVPAVMIAEAAAQSGACIGYLPGTSVIFRSAFENGLSGWISSP